MSLVKEHGHPVTLVVFAPLGEYLRSAPRQQWAFRSSSIKRDFGLTVQRLPLPPSRATGLWDGEFLFRRWLRKRFQTADRVILHCRGATAANLALRVSAPDPRFRVVFDCRGLDAVEFLYVRGYRSAEDAPPEICREADARDEAQRQAALNSHAMICVSQTMKREVVAAWSVPPDRIWVIPCGADIEAGERAIAARAAMRQQLGLQGKFVVAYCGSLMAWQMPEESLAVFRLVAGMRSDAHFLAITTQPAGMAAAVDRVGLSADQRTIVSVPGMEVPAYLAAADAGLLIRESSPVNRVASPVKFAEYLSCALPVIVSDAVGDYSDLVQREGLGAVLPYHATAEQAETLLVKFLTRYEQDAEALRAHCQAVAERELDIGRNVENIAFGYQRLLIE